MTPNPYRCQTCKNDKCDFYKDNISDDPEDFRIWGFTHLKGCASHSDFQSERDKALDELHNWFNNYCEGNVEAELWMAFLHAERSLRSKEGDG